MTKLRVLLADDHETVREGLKTIINAQPDMEVVGEAADGRAAVTRATTLQPDLIVMDVTMPEMNGLMAVELLRRGLPGAKVLTLTRHSDAGFVHQLLRAGAAGYVLKQSRSADLLHAIRVVAAGGTYLDPAVAGRLVDEIRRRAPAAGPGREADLSAREEEVLKLVAWGYSNKEIAAQLGLSVKTIESHKTNATQKLGLQGRIDVVKFALLHGWLQDT